MTKKEDYQNKYEELHNILQQYEISDVFKAFYTYEKEIKDAKKISKANAKFMNNDYLT
ncbi:MULTISPECIES: hypothetical protein [Staphylococcus]|uniref:hypothetical protein n=1 Tax=Staphylococcus TaxID=1279 RepID=UPI00194DF0E9|nr:hypothetical protein [Staphylococcus xylosus]MBM6639601.1 hypothetical protein [Staphylococcus xylosus]